MAHFYDTIPAELTALPPREAVERYAAGASAPAQAIAGLTADQVGSHPVPERWSIRQVVLHLMDVDLIGSYRIKRILAEDNPTLDLFDEVAFAQNLGYEQQDAAAAAEVFRLNRALTADMLRRLPDEDFERTGNHGEVGPVSIGFYVRLFTHHVAHHMKFVHKKRTVLGVT
ncbi:MAG: DinB family protein [Planctomycetota bacterium]|nr:DinB family protein [Planctomycetota bacterium]